MKNKELHIGHLPDLAVVPIDQIRFHENPDPDICKRLAETIGNDGFLKNPPIILVNEKKDLILLDGANRTEAMKQLGLKHLFVQLVDIRDPLLSVSVWSHAVENVSRHVFERHISGFHGQNGPDTTINGKNMDLCSIRCADGDVLKVQSRGKMSLDIKMLHAITELYLGKNRSDRVSYDDMDDLKMNYSDFSALVQFRSMTINDLITAALTGNRIPSGISRILVPKRTLHFNFPIDILNGKDTIEGKNIWLKRNISERVRAKSIRFYREPTFIFDE